MFSGIILTAKKETQNIRLTTQTFVRYFSNIKNTSQKCLRDFCGRQNKYFTLPQIEMKNVQSRQITEGWKQKHLFYVATKKQKIVGIARQRKIKGQNTNYEVYAKRRKRSTFTMVLKSTVFTDEIRMPEGSSSFQ